MTQTPTQFDAIILGAGAAGLMCAATAAKRGKRVLVLEKANKIGKKILMSGGGRCNFTNLNISADNFISANPHFCKSALSRYTQWDFIALVNEHGVHYEERDHGQLFCTGSAADILRMLEKECEEVGVQILTHCHPIEIQTAQAGFSLCLEQQGTPLLAQCTSLAVATGALSIPTLGGSDMGYRIAQQFGIRVTERRPGLVPMMFSDYLKPICDRLSGVSLPVTLQCHARSFSLDMLFTHRGLSGPAILQISNYWHPGDELTINLLPQHPAASWLIGQKKEQPRKTLRAVLSRLLPKPLVGELQTLWWPQYAETGIAEIPDQQLKALGTKLNSWSVKPSASEGYRTAEVTLGGVDTDEISSKTFEAKKQPGLFFIGEVLDVTGHLGGYNFQWAWSSGYAAGSAL